jgi:hypothetical protein
MNAEETIASSGNAVNVIERKRIRPSVQSDVQSDDHKTTATTTIADFLESDYRSILNKEISISFTLEPPPSERMVKIPEKTPEKQPDLCHCYRNCYRTEALDGREHCLCKRNMLSARFEHLDDDHEDYFE